MRKFCTFHFHQSTNSFPMVIGPAGISVALCHPMPQSLNHFGTSADGARTGCGGEDNVGYPVLPALVLRYSNSSPNLFACRGPQGLAARLVRTRWSSCFAQRPSWSLVMINFFFFGLAGWGLEPTPLSSQSGRRGIGLLSTAFPPFVPFSSPPGLDQENHRSTD